MYHKNNAAVVVALLSSTLQQARSFSFCLQGTGALASRRFHNYHSILAMSTTTSSNDDDTIAFSSETLQVYHLKRTVKSTQDEAKRILSVSSCNSHVLVAVIANDQSNGRGTSGRSWVASPGNLYLTCAIPMHMVPMRTITMLPLGCGIVIAETLGPYIAPTATSNTTATGRLTLKWPNDVLLDGCKVAGTLIENYRTDENKEDWWLVGIGINVESHPKEIPSETDDAKGLTPRSATCLRSYSTTTATTRGDSSSKQLSSSVPSALQLGISLAQGLQSFTERLGKQQSPSSSDDRRAIIRKWKSYADFETTYTIRNTGETVQIVDLQSDGQLKVVGADGRQRLLAADYFL
eukprot:scaffold25947_cov127-Cylindrotheca_fusiformis.AAC.1